MADADECDHYSRPSLKQCPDEGRNSSKDISQMTEQSAIGETPAFDCSSDLARSTVSVGINQGLMSSALDSANDISDKTLVSATDVDGQASALDPIMTSDESIEAAAAAAEVSQLDFSFLTEVEAMIKRKLSAVRRLKEERAAFIQSIEQAEAEVHRTVEQLHGLVDNKTNELLATAASVRADRTAHFERTKAELEATLNTVKLNKEFAEHVLSNASPQDILHLAPAVHLMSEHLQHEQERVLAKARAPYEDERLAELASFAGLDVNSLVRNVGGNLVGSIDTSESVEAAVASGSSSPYLNAAQPLISFSAGGRVKGLAILKNCVHVLLERCSVIDVRESDTPECSSVNQVVVEQLNFPDCIVGIESVQCIYVSDSQISGLFRILMLEDAAISLIPLESVPSGLSVLPSGLLVFTYVETKTVQIASVDNVALLRVVSVNDLCRPIRAAPVPGEGNGTIVCDDTEDGLNWFLCGHQLEGAAASALEHPFQLYSLKNVCCLVSDAYGMYVGMSTVSDNISVYDASFNRYRPLLTTSDGLRGISCFALNSCTGKIAVGLQDGTVRLFQVMKTRQRIEIKLRKWV